MEPPSELPPHNSACQQSLTAMMLTFKNLNIPVAPSKTQGPATVLEFKGIILDSVRMEARLPADKIERLFCLQEDVLSAICFIDHDPQLCM